MLIRLTVVCVALALPLSAVAHENQKNPEIRYRHAIMEALSNQFVAMGLILQAKVERPDEMVVNARALAENVRLIAGLFPDNSKGAKALPLIWDEPEKVAQAAQRAVDTADALVAAAADGNRQAIARAFKAAGDSCKGCHERYKEADD